VYEDDKNPKWLIRLGVAIYGALSLGRRPGPSRGLSAAATLREEPGLRREGLTGGVEYYDCATDDGRLTLETLMDAHAAGAVFLPRTEVVGGVAVGDRLTGLAVRDLLDGEEYDLRAKVVVNATGPWADGFHERVLPGRIPKWLRPTKGVHLVFSRDRLCVDRAVAMIVKEDGRPVFVVPWGNTVYVGTTDTDVADPEAPQETRITDIEYMLRVTNRYFPEARLTEDDVMSSWVGLRPLVWDEEAQSASDVSREERIEEAAPGLVTIAGGKLTTYLLMSRKTADLAARCLTRDHGMDVPRSVAAKIPLQAIRRPGGIQTATVMAAAIAEQLKLPIDGAALAARRGFTAMDLIDRMRVDRSLAEPCVEGLPWLRAELRYAMDHEYACTAEDLLVRRTHLHYRDIDHGAGVDLSSFLR